MGEILKKRLKQSRFQSPEQEAMLNVMVTSSYIEDIFTKACAEHGISHQQYNILRILRGVHPQGHPCGEIAERMLSRAPDITRRLDRLVKLGLVQRDRLDDDRRVVITKITDKGLELLKGMDAQVQRSHSVISDRLSEEECLELSRLCEKIYGEEKERS
jgi:DNA-binding MarR family transcriptional regulator